MKLMIQCGQDIQTLNSMNNQIFLAASLICADPINLGRDIDQINEALLDFIHFDVMDGSFVSRYGLYPEILVELKKKSKIPVDVHMMVDNPEIYIDTFKTAGADYYNVHIEACKQLSRVIRKIRDAGMRPGVALNPATPISNLEWVISDIDMVVVMAINPGIVGHPFIPSMLQKITDIREMARQKGNHNLHIQVDGGVTPTTAGSMISAGADILVCGTGTIFRPHEDTIVNKTKLLREIIADYVV
jgi:ribulose-phosphate 3-epimerase